MTTTTAFASGDLVCYEAGSINLECIGIVLSVKHSLTYIFYVSFLRDDRTCWRSVTQQDGRGEYGWRKVENDLTMRATLNASI